MMYSKAKIDKAGSVLSKPPTEITEESIELEYAFDDFRKRHLAPLSELTLDIQKMLTEYGGRYYIAQRLKRKPQILRKLNRFSVRLTQLQDIGGLRIIVDKNTDVDNLIVFLEQKIQQQKSLYLKKKTDYREKGRDVTGYRSVHLIIESGKLNLELQIRSKIQHYWAESIERTSVIYGYLLKEQEGDTNVINYFKELSDIFFEMEAGRLPSVRQKLSLNALREVAEKIIKNSDRGNVLAGYVNDDIIKTLIEIEAKNPNGLNNWILVFDWSSGNFVTWDVVGRDPATAVETYIKYEKQYTEDRKFEVVLIGSSDIATVKQTHSHYFGIDSFEDILENLDQSIIGFSERMELDVGARQILAVMTRKKYWGEKEISPNTLKNHYCQTVLTFEASLKALADKGFLNQNSINGPVSLNIKKRSLVEQQL
ncbi:ppGpp synthetase/RelA/SpoT-type nucleotidyltransferase [Rhizobium sp. BK512]|uniref:RelA/SpoT domain-containing protein n=1 Tax=Rhizobium sp. BK512 TaxID=2587010 RepID=UPI0016185A5A|nr:RelA/SpoT domain-containing protein [Rhizobium sp. BK512]MBB3560137.1 ppGpp synthetase/RelA/SpoT-type nucleotidyltransferase [Rhizobium sp. BK512]